MYAQPTLGLLGRNDPLLHYIAITKAAVGLGLAHIHANVNNLANDQRRIFETLAHGGLGGFTKSRLDGHCELLGDLLWGVAFVGRHEDLGVEAETFVEGLVFGGAVVFGGDEFDRDTVGVGLTFFAAKGFLLNGRDHHSLCSLAENWE